MSKSKVGHSCLVPGTVRLDAHTAQEIVDQLARQGIRAEPAADESAEEVIAGWRRYQQSITREIVKKEETPEETSTDERDAVEKLIDICSQLEEPMMGFADRIIARSRGL